MCPVPNAARVHSAESAAVEISIITWPPLCSASAWTQPFEQSRGGQVGSRELAASCAHLIES